MTHMPVCCDLRRFVEEAFGDEAVQVYDAFPLGVMRADFWRWVVAGLRCSCLPRKCETQWEPAARQPDKGPACAALGKTVAPC